ncbi:bis(5'-nucleosyl)-tetraphosphatase (symmetrical) YqeK [Jeotgalibaca sp. MA1X17-3]|uniref:bis(5'-nucleosyl)-tetraphosphatase (symmetrical) YqeK n=1 Tax=Jeotgalibaca sp. MA1X17-3 TaxID=2908211 RepID=UPI001F203177|nr:bis(5'-nucleosyl)-tetraphosphatase (symmetrical) YqeK [Jeotgalibaca sp. MA1X17-3]UJF16694.1 bis(5'-nucleosyl)-tetraphosphatase (symmetrical) YqeK [Jeotgalibaca sp. MA1X17-3]
MVYSEKYTSWTRDDILTEVKSKMKIQRFEHILRVEKSALELAQRYKGNLEACSLAAILHDYAKELPKETMDSIVQEEQWNPEILQYGSQIWHGPAGAYFAEKKFGITDETILTAIRDHTIGSEKMSLTGKILFVADYIEPGRKFPGVQNARALAMESLDQAVMFKITQTIIHLVEKGILVYPETLTVYNAWVRNKEEIY